MTRDEAKSILEASFARPTATPSYDWERAPFLERQKAKLRADLIEPTDVDGVACQWAQDTMGLDNVVRPFVAIARSGDTWLLYCESVGTFWQASGTPESEPLLLLGYSSDDALCEWYG